MAEIGKVARSELVISYTGPERWLAALADAVVDFVVLLLDLSVERRRACRLRSAGLWDSLTGRRQIVLVQKMPGRWPTELRGDVTAACPGHRPRRKPSAR